MSALRLHVVQFALVPLAARLLLVGAPAGFPSPATERHERLMQALDDINGRFGKFSVVPGIQGYKREWKMRSETKSPAWTTRIDEVPRVRAI